MLWLLPSSMLGGGHIGAMLPFSSDIFVVPKSYWELIDVCVVAIDGDTLAILLVDGDVKTVNMSLLVWFDISLLSIFFKSLASNVLLLMCELWPAVSDVSSLKFNAQSNDDGLVPDIDVFALTVDSTEFVTLNVNDANDGNKSSACCAMFVTCMFDDRADFVDVFITLVIVFTSINQYASPMQINNCISSSHSHILTHNYSFMILLLSRYNNVFF